MYDKNTKLKNSTLKFVASIIRNEKEQMMKKYEIVKDRLALTILLQEVRNSFKEDIRIAIRVLNGLPILDDSFLEKDIFLEEYDDRDTIELLGSDYFYKSILWDGRTDTVEISSNVFKGRFIMNMLVFLNNNLANILSREMKYRLRKGNVSDEVDLIYQIRNCIGTFIENFSTDKEYKEELMKISELIAASNKSSFKKVKKCFDISLRELDRIQEMMYPGFLNGKRPADDVFIQNISLIAFVLGSGSSDVKHTFMAPEDITFKDKERIKALVEILGSCIMKQIKHSEFPEIYRWYRLSYPKVLYRFNDINYNKNLAEGCRALNFVDFYAREKSITKIISKMIY